MDQELTCEININKDIKAENIKKALIAVFSLVLFGCIYYYYHGMHNQDIQNPKISSTKMTNNKRIKIQQKVILPIVSAKTITLPNKKIITSNSSPVIIKTSGYIRPTDKNSILKLALSSAGKTDPFSGIGKASLPAKMLTSLPAIGKIPTGKIILPRFTNSLPTIANMSNTSIPSFMPSLSQDFAIKGFISDEVIVEIDGIVQSLQINSSFHGLKVLKIDPENLSAVFRIKGKIVTKSIKNSGEI